MQLNSEILFFFSAIGVFNGLLLALYLAISKPREISKQFLAGLLLVICIRVSKSIWFYFDPEVSKQFLQFGLSACFLIGPFLYFYSASVTNRLDKLTVSWRLHLSCLIALMVVVGILFPYQSHQTLWGSVIFKIVNWTWLFYILLSAALLWTSFKSREKLGERIHPPALITISVFVGTLLIWISYFTASYTSYISGALSFSFVLYLTIILGLKNNKKLQTEEPTKYKHNKIDDQLVTLLNTKLDGLMTTEHLYKNPNLTLPELAKKLQVSVPQLSQFLNHNLSTSFADYVNKLRINEAKKLLLSKSRLTMELIAEQSGYNSQSTFYSAFRKFERCTPAMFRNKAKSVEATKTA
jgi:AraC-like DNA-binding protein